MSDIRPRWYRWVRAIGIPLVVTVVLVLAGATLAVLYTLDQSYHRRYYGL